jgi:hypothetical protein
MTETYAVLNRPKQHRITTVWDDVMDFSGDHNGVLMLTFGTERIAA